MYGIELAFHSQAIADTSTAIHVEDKREEAKERALGSLDAYYTVKYSTCAKKYLAYFPN